MFEKVSKINESFLPINLQLQVVFQQIADLVKEKKYTDAKDLLDGNYNLLNNQIK